MKAYLAFTKKEFTEYVRTYKLLILGLVFLLFGMMNPVLAKFTPEIIKAAGLDLQLPEPTALDSWTQFFKNVGQMGMVVMVVIFSGIMANEFSKGTLINILTKGLKRSTVILSKFSVASMIWTFSYFFCFGVTYIYTLVFWEMTGLHQVFWTFFSPWLYGELLIALLILGGVLFKSSIGSLLLVGGLTVLMTLLSIFPQFHDFNPMTLSSDNMALLMGLKELSTFIPALLICFILTILVMISSIVLFDHEQV
jgi:ABC-2 type transport system permease protein